MRELIRFILQFSVRFKSALLGSTAPQATYLALHPHQLQTSYVAAVGLHSKWMPSDYPVFETAEGIEKIKLLSKTLPVIASLQRK